MKNVGTVTRLALDPDPPAVGLDDLTADGQARSRPFVLLAGVQPAEELEDRLVELGLDADPIVLDGDAWHLRRDRRR